MGHDSARELKIQVVGMGRKVALPQGLCAIQRYMLNVVCIGFNGC